MHPDAALGGSHVAVVAQGRDFPIWNRAAAAASPCGVPTPSRRVSATPRPRPSRQLSHVGPTAFHIRQYTESYPAPSPFLEVRGHCANHVSAAYNYRTRLRRVSPYSTIFYSSPSLTTSTLIYLYLYFLYIPSDMTATPNKTKSKLTYADSKCSCTPRVAGALTCALSRGRPRPV